MSMEQTAILLYEIIETWWMQQGHNTHRYALALIIDMRLRLEIICTLNPLWWRIIPAITKPQYWKAEAEVRVAWLALDVAINWYMLRKPVQSPRPLDERDLSKIAG